MTARLTPPDPPLSDGVVTLRLWTERDVRELVAAVNDPEIARWILTVQLPFGEKDARAFLRRARDLWRDGTRPSFAVCAAGDGDVLGNVNLRSDGWRRGEIGYWVRKDARGRGVATRALRLISIWALCDLGLRRVQLHADVENVASQRVAERAGYTREGVLRAWLEVNGESRDHVLYSLLADDLGAEV